VNYRLPKITIGANNNSLPKNIRYLSSLLEYLIVLRQSKVSFAIGQKTPL
jgi:hypothetical protein